jgi:FkbM family methyltransferase
MRKMKRLIKNILRWTPLESIYRRLRMNRQLRDFWNWDQCDEGRADFYRQFFGPGELVFDVGANMGNRTKVFHKLNAHVVAFEPQACCHAFLSRAFRGKESVTIVDRALGKSEGTAEMCIPDADVLGSLSSDWIRATKQSGRFGEQKWDKRQSVEITTLDKAIRQFGIPRFIKIDVEGYEFEVLSGLSTPINCISVEFTPEYIENTLRCIDHMSSLATIEAQFSLGESMGFAMPSWVDTQTIKQVLTNIDGKAWGDVYIRCLTSDALNRGH